MLTVDRGIEERLNRNARRYEGRKVSITRFGDGDILDAVEEASRTRDDLFFADSITEAFSSLKGENSRLARYTRVFAQGLVTEYAASFERVFREWSRHLRQRERFLDLFTETGMYRPKIDIYDTFFGNRQLNIFIKQYESLRVQRSRLWQSFGEQPVYLQEDPFRFDEIGTGNLLLVFNLPKPLSIHWFKGTKIRGEVVPWGQFYEDLMPVVHQHVGNASDEHGIYLSRINGLGVHHPRSFYYLWEVFYDR